MKKIIIATLSLCLSIAAFANADSAINDHAVFNFNRSFPNATHVNWVNLDEFYQVDFTQGDVRCVLLMHSHDASFFRLIKHENAKQLNPKILNKLKRHYKGKTILGGTEVQYENGTVYQVIIVDKKNLYIVFIDPDGAVHLLNKFKKAD